MKKKKKAKKQKMPQVCTTDLNLSISHATYYDLEVFMWVNYPVWASMGMHESCHEMKW